MSLAAEIEYKRFMTHIGHWSWVHLMYRFTPKHLIVADFEFVQFLRSARADKLPCPIITPDEIDGLDQTGIEKILVFLRMHEVPTVRKLEAMYPEATVCSATYGFSCVGPNRTPKFAKLSERPKGVQHKTLFLSTAYSGIEFVGAAMGQKGMPVPHEFFARPLIRWLERHRGFQPLRFLAEIERRFTTKEGEAPIQILQMDVLAALLKHSNLSLSRFIKFLDAQDIKIVSLRRHDKLAQVAEAQLLDYTAERSVWTKKPTKKLQNKIEQVPFGACVSRLDKLQQEEALLATIEEALLPSKILKLTFEDFVTDQPAGLTSIAEHIGFSAPTDANNMSYLAGYETAPDIRRLTDVVVRQFIDGIGVHQLPAPRSEKLEIRPV